MSEIKDLMSPSIKELAAALAAAQSEMGCAVKDSENPFYKSSFADLENVIEVCRPVLPKNGLSVSQVTRLIGDRMALVTILMHKSGEWLAGEYLLTPAKADPQSMAGAVTFARRYALKASVNMSDTDDDGESATGRTAPRKPSLSLSDKPKPPSSEQARLVALGWDSQAGQRKAIKAISDVGELHGWSKADLEDHLHFGLNLASTDDLPWELVDSFKAFISEHPKNRE
jgi:hypothetical protein